MKEVRQILLCIPLPSSPPPLRLLPELSPKDPDLIGSRRSWLVRRSKAWLLLLGIILIFHIIIT